MPMPMPEIKIILLLWRAVLCYHHCHSLQRSNLVIFTDLEFKIMR